MAALRHRNLLTIHDFGSEHGISYSVMELLVGETLRARLERSIPAWQEAVKLSLAVAEGLAAAHSKGVVHRDLKPENVFLTADGEVEILDFGLSRLKEASSALDAVPTAETQPGTILGTFPYMPPEHVRGCAIDERSDIFSFGSMFYEVLTGDCPFGRESPAEIMAAILKEDPPPMARSGRAVPRDLDRIVSKCLEKKPGQRYQSDGEVAGLLKSILSEIGTRPRRRFLLAMISIFALAVPLVAAVVFLLLRHTPDPIEEAQYLKQIAYILDTEEQEKIEKAIEKGGLRVAPEGRRAAG